MFIDKTDRYVIAIAVSRANRIMTTEDFYFDVANSTYTHTDDSPEVVAHSLKLTFNTYDIRVTTYKPWWRWSKAIAYVSKNNPFEVHLNAYKINKSSVDSITQTLIHEICHSAGYGHGDNKKKGKENSVPRKVATLAKKYLSYTSC